MLSRDALLLSELQTYLIHLFFVWRVWSAGRWGRFILHIVGAWAKE
jgi:hypothetical protein